MLDSTAQLHFVIRTPFAGDAAFEVCRDLAKLPLARCEVLVLHFGHVAALDEAGVAALTRIHGNLSRAGVALRLAGVRPAVGAELARLGLGDVIAMAPGDPAGAWPRQLAPTRA